MLKKKISYALQLVNRKRLTTVAGAWVYYFMTSAVPLVFLFITAFGVFGVDIAKEIVAMLPLEFRSAGQTIINTAKNASEGVTVFFVIAVIFSCTTLLNQMSKDGDYIFEANYKIRRGILRRVWAVFALSILYLIFLALAMLFVFSNAFGIDLLFLGKSSIVLTILAFFGIIAFSYAIILALNKFICPYKISFYQISIGALISLAIMVLGTIFFIIYARFFASYNAFYGSLAGIIFFLLWTYILMLALVLGAIINNEIVQSTRRSSHVKNSKLHKKIW